MAGEFANFIGTRSRREFPGEFDCAFEMHATRSFDRIHRRAADLRQPAGRRPPRQAEKLTVLRRACGSGQMFRIARTPATRSGPPRPPRVRRPRATPARVRPAPAFRRHKDAASSGGRAASVRIIERRPRDWSCSCRSESWRRQFRQSGRACRPQSGTQSRQSPHPDRRRPQAQQRDRPSRSMALCAPSSCSVKPFALPARNSTCNPSEVFR